MNGPAERLGKEDSTDRSPANEAVEGTRRHQDRLPDQPLFRLLNSPFIGLMPPPHYKSSKDLNLVKKEQYSESDIVPLLETYMTYPLMMRFPTPKAVDPPP